MVVVFWAIICFVFLVLIMTYRYSFPKTQVIGLLLLLVVSLAFLGALIEPKSIYDLYRHYDLLSSIKNSTYSLKNYLIHGPNLLNSNYRYTYLFNILCFVIARYLPFQALPFIAIFVSYSCLLYVIIDHFGKGDLTNRNVLLSLSLCQVIMPYLYVYSGIRNAMASAIIAFAIYRFYFKNHNYIELVALTVCSFMIHPVSFAIVPFIFLAKIKLDFKRMLIPLLLPSLLFVITEFFRLRSGNDLLIKFGAKYYNYTQVRADNQGKAFYLCALMIMACILLYNIYHLVKKQPISSNDMINRLMNLVTWYALFSIGYFSSYELFTRLPYNMAILSPIMVSSFSSRNDEQSIFDKGWPVLIAGLFALSTYETVMWLLG